MLNSTILVCKSYYATRESVHSTETGCWVHLHFNGITLLLKLTSLTWLSSKIYRSINTVTKMNCYFSKHFRLIMVIYIGRRWSSKILKIK